ncbi:MAG: DMT family transporter [Desulfohalobiaceae bacterium]
MQRQTQASLLALATVLIWSTVASAFKLSLRQASVTQLLFFSSMASVLVLGLIVVLQGQGPRLSRCTTKDILYSALLGLLNPFAYYFILLQAYDLLPAQEAQPLNYTWAITLSLLAVPLLGQPLRKIDLLALVISYAGVYIISTRGDILALQFSNPKGVALALGSTVIWALYWILNTKDPLPAACRLFLNFAWGSLFVGLVLLFSSGPVLPSSLGLLGAAYIGLFEMGITFLLWSTALKLSSSTARVSIFIYLSPFLSLLFIRFLVGEEILPSTLPGLLLIVCGIMLQQAGQCRQA